MASMKFSLVVGEDSNGKLSTLYLGLEGEDARRVYRDALNGKIKGVVKASLDLQHRADRCREVPEDAKLKESPKPKWGKQKQSSPGPDTAENAVS